MSRKLNDSCIADWENYYAARGVVADFSNIIIPEYDDQLFRPILMPAHRDLTINMALAMARKNYPVATYLADDDLDGQIIHNARILTSGSYVILVQVDPEVYQGHQSKSAIETDPYGMIGINVRERLVFGDKVFDETGKHLDTIGGTRCTGSRCVDGGVPSVGGNGGSVRVCRCNPRSHTAHHDFRKVVL